jgi:hypothetical protein
VAFVANAEDFGMAVSAPKYDQPKDSEWVNVDVYEQLSAEREDRIYG